MRIFLTGATGFIGSNLLNRALELGHFVYAVKRPGSQPRITINHEPAWLDGALDADWGEALRNSDVLIHLAASGVSTGVNDWDACFQLNLTTSLRLWQQAVNCNVRRFIICGSCFEYGKLGSVYDYIPPNSPLWPTSAYSASKAAATLAAIALAETHKLSLVVARPFHVYGHGEDSQRFWPSLVNAALSGKDFPMTNGKQIRDFAPVSSIVNMILDLANETSPGGRFSDCTSIVNLGTGQPRSLREFAEEQWEKYGASGQLQMGLIPCRANEVMRYVPDLGQHKGCFSWAPRKNRD